MTKKKKVVMHLLVIVGYAFFIAANYWTLLSGENYMKWDIMQAEYPLQVMMSDAITNGALPLWNPLMNMGMPYYSIAGMPVWYPITLLLACFGYTPWTISFEYVIHLFLAAYGMFLLSSSFLKDRKGKWFIAFIIGLVYCGSGLFLSNAEHIMLVISAAWFPYVFYFTKRFLEEKTCVFLLAGALCAGFIISGGYPEMFYDLFLILVPYFIYMIWDDRKTIWRNILKAAGSYMLFCICTVMACAITLLPFIHVMLYITRTATTEQAVCVTPFINILSVILPKAGAVLSNCEISMCNYYTGILTLIAAVSFSKQQLKKKWIFAGITLFAFLMSWGEYSPLYMLCHKYLPMYAAFRFPSVFRPLFTLFFLLMLAETLDDMLYGNISKRSFFLTGGLVVLGIWGIWLYKRQQEGRVTVPPWNTELQGEMFINGMTGLLVVSVIYLIMLFILSNKHANLKVKIPALLIALIVELSVFIQAEMPITITFYDAIEAHNDPTIQDEVQSWYIENEERNKNINFSGNSRTTTRYTWDTKNIVFGKTFDDEGYLSVKLQNTEQYKQSFNRSIIEANPIAYFTNNIVDQSQVDLTDWCASGTVPREQIYINALEPDMHLDMENKIHLNPDILSAVEGNVSIENSTILFEGYMTFDGNTARYIIVQLEDTELNSCFVDICFEDTTGQLSEYSDNYTIKRVGEDPYIEIFFPDPKADYIKVIISTQQLCPVGMEVVYTERMKKDNYVTVDYFSYNDIHISVQAPSDGYIALLQSNYPGWNAYIDGQKVEIETVNGCFIGLPIKGGNHQVKLEFRPVDFFIGLGITGIFLVVLSFLIVQYLFNRKKKYGKISQNEITIGTGL